MRRALAIALALGFALVGCATGPTTRSSCGPALNASPTGPHRVVVHFLNDGDLDRRLCIKLNEAGPFDALVRREMFTPNVGEIANVTIAGDSLRVVAWIAGATARYEETFSFSAEEDHIVLATTREGGLRIDHFDHPPLFL